MEEQVVIEESAYEGTLYGVVMLDNVVLCYGDDGVPVIAYDNDLTEEQTEAFSKWIQDLVKSENNRLAASPEA